VTFAFLHDTGHRPTDLVIPRQKTLKHHHQRVTTLTGISGSYEPEYALYKTEADLLPDLETQTLTIRLHHLANVRSSKLQGLIRFLTYL
jgi:hypothetical protein